MSVERLRSVLPRHLAGFRLDRALARVFGDHSRSRIQHSIREGRVRVDGRVAESAMRIAGGERVELELAPFPAVETWEPDSVAFGLVYEDSELIVIDKRAGLVVHPGAGNRTRTLANGLLQRYPELARLPRAGVVHRLDKDTSGLLVVARSPDAHRHLVAEMQRRAVEREYVAIVWGRPSAERGSINASIARHRSHRTRMSVSGEGRHAVTHFEVRAHYSHFSRLRVRLETGRTHQIRVHMHHMGHPVAGDPVYGTRRRIQHLPAPVQEALRGLAGQALHACRLALLHPRDNVKRQWRAPLPQDMRALLAALDQSLGSGNLIGIRPQTRAFAPSAGPSAAATRTASRRSADTGTRGDAGAPRRSMELLVPRWPAPAGVRAFCTTRPGGVSRAPYDSLNLSFGVGDDAGAVAENRALLAASLRLPEEPLWMRQVHGARVLEAATAEADSEGDGCIARTPGVPCVVSSADCLPVLLCAGKGSLVAAAHAGWRGLVAGILENTVAEMGVPPSENHRVARSRHRRIGVRSGFRGARCVRGPKPRRRGRLLAFPRQSLER